MKKFIKASTIFSLLVLSSFHVNADHKPHSSNQQVMLKVRFGEIDRLKAHNLKLAGIKSVECLKKYGAFKTYAEPTLIAMSGEKAKFFSGGEIPVMKGANGTIKYQSYGIELEFKPVVHGRNIRIDIDYNIKDLDKNKSHTLPAFIKSRASTTVQLAQGESFMISGIVKESQDVDVSNHLGIFSNIFAPKSGYEQTEMVLSITPYFVEPIKHEEIKLPTDNFDVQNEINSLLGKSITITE
ncbi:type II and III secretion system protein family protein [Rickettsiales endosymbiont of Stachyamoeba lipophora]|uniref:hypothetical protein n=1 Tax=Rickettsiales endosymbiont of Stachyamoeba lipophora TaxID=2486578 RepID=UPI000F64EE18|nr:hypothetical protein [Rickettsiales endosymbiont of Stachyamoeba lipophora]AZL15798.1 hypothetical protein EF513_04470 [Rickettsiales endosymbiont of Stachyamoeba lipophora]